MPLRIATLGVAVLGILVLAFAGDVRAAEPASKTPTRAGDAMIAEYFAHETRQLTENCLAEIKTLDDWLARRDEYRRQLFEMLGLDPLPPKSPLEATVTGKVDHDAFTVEKVHFQSMPGLYVTGNLYVPKQLEGKAPAILYVCGHGPSKKDGVSFGNKATYQHHGAWFARNGYVCLTIDTLQMGEIESIHHGTYRYGMWWWNARGYSSAGVEAWNSIRALDYLQSRDEVDGERLGVTGRSGGGAYSWWISALDERIKVAVPVAGITSLHNHVVDGCVEGHCDCMFMVNTYRWDFPLVAALMAPRPLLISNSDKDRIFPLEGVVDVYTQTRKIYGLYDATDKLGLQITEGPHKDTQELRIHAFVWFNRYLKGEDPLIEMAAVKFFEPPQLKVFETLPDAERNTTIHESFTKTPEPPAVPESAAEWNSQRDAWLSALREKSFRGWPDFGGAAVEPPQVQQVFEATHDDIRLVEYEFTSQHGITLPLYILSHEDRPLDQTELVVFNVLDATAWNEFSATTRGAFPSRFSESGETQPRSEDWDQLAKTLSRRKSAMAFLPPRGIGPTAWDPSDRKQTQNRRRFMLLGQTRDGMQAWDVRRGIQALRGLMGDAGPLSLMSSREMAGVTLYASLFEPGIDRLQLLELPASHRDGPIFLNVLRYLDVPQALALAAERSEIQLLNVDRSDWSYPLDVAKSLDWPVNRIEFREVKSNEGSAPD